MNYERRQQIEDLFEAALEKSSATRQPFLERAGAGDPELLAEVQALLAAHELAEQLFDEAAAPDSGATNQIGNYRLIREVGRGGMGTVFLAERADGQYRRRVAIKLIATANADDPLHQRFLAERQILAGLEHPSIARLLDGGITDDGRPYLVLEYVDGLPITLYCDRHRLDIEERLRLFLHVCEAVSHAHQNLVIHRDLKPGNILVTPAGQVRLLDFGIAKLLNPTLSVASAPVTRLDLRVMTPEYASPEQVQGDSITTSSDVYSLGVLLYEILTGSPPYQLTTASPVEVVQAICERDPERPSVRVGRAETLPRQADRRVEVTRQARATSRATTPDRLRRQLRGDLDSIVSMAMRKEPARRYGSADLLAQDIRRHLEGLPVVAHVGSSRYRLQKFMRRHRAESIAVLIVAISLMVGAGIASWQAAVAGRERDRADAARSVTEQALAQSEEVTNFLMGLFQSGDSDSFSPPEEVSARDLLRRGTERAAELAEQPLVQARLLDVIGRMYYHLGHFDDAQRLLEQAVAIRRRNPDLESRDLAESLIHLSWVHRSRGETDRAGIYVREALDIRRRALQADDPALAEAVHELGWLAVGADQERLYREALQILQRGSQRPDYQIRLLQGIATNLRRQGREAEAVTTDREALRFAEREFGPDDHRTGYAMIHYADQVRDIEQDLAAAEALYRRGLDLIERHSGEKSLDLVHGLHGLALLLSRQGNHGAAEQLLRRALTLRQAAIGPDHPLVARSMVGLAGMLERQDRVEEAESLVLLAIDKLSRAFGPQHLLVADAMPLLADLRFRQNRAPEAETLYEDALRIRASGEGAFSRETGEMRRRYGRMLLAQKRFERAEQQLLQSFSILERNYGSADHPNALESRRALMELYQQWGKPELVERYRAPPGEYQPY